MPLTERDELEAYLKTASEFEAAAGGLLARMSKGLEGAHGGGQSSIEYELVRAMEQFGGRTTLELAKSAHALKFVASPTVQVRTLSLLAS